MPNTSIKSKELWEKELKRIYFIAIVVCSAWFLAAGVICREAIMSLIEDARTFAMFAIGVALFLTWWIYEIIKTLNILPTEYECTDNCVRMWSKKFENSVNITESFYVTRIYCMFGGRRSTPVKFLLFSSNPIDKTLDPDEGRFMFYQIAGAKDVVIPQNDEDIHQILTRKGIREIPEFPESIYYSRTDS